MSKYNEIETERIAEAIAGKIANHGINPANFNDEKIVEALSHCVLANKLIDFYYEEKELVYCELEKLFL